MNFMKFTKFIIDQTQENNPKKSLKNRAKGHQARIQDTQKIYILDFTNKINFTSNKKKSKEDKIDDANRVRFLA